MKSKWQAKGFTLLEILTVVAVIVILGAIAITGYQSYVARARASEIVLKYDAIRSAMGSALAGGQQVADCAELANRLGDANLKDEHAQLAYGFEAVAGGYRPVLTVCANTGAHGAVGVGIARGAHETLSKTARVEAGAVLTDTLVSFALPLTDSANAACIGQRPPARAQSACKVPTSCPPGRESVKLPNGTELCAISCSAGNVRDTANPLLCIPAAKPAAAVPAQPVLGSSSPSAPRIAPPAGVDISYSTQARVQRPDSYWLGQLRGIASPDGSPIRIISLQVDPAFATIVGGPDNWGFQFAKPGVNGRATVTVTLQNGAGTTTGQFIVGIDN